MFFSTALYASLFIFVVGVIYKMAGWFGQNPDNNVDSTLPKRLLSTFKSMIAVTFSKKIFSLLKALILDVLLQIRILRESPLRWVAHMLICWGFIFLLLTHALDHFTLRPLVAPYYPTLNPYLFLRNLFGAMVVVGILLSVLRRYFLTKGPRLTNAMDTYVLVLLAVVFVSGILLETVRLTSRTEFEFMVSDYAGLDPEADQEEIEQLESYWVQDFGLVSARVNRPFDAQTLEAGRQTHEMFCAECHSSYQWAFMSYGTSKIIGPTIALKLDKHAVISFLWYLHVLSCFAGLAYLPFSKMFHVITSPISLLANAVMGKEKSLPLNIATRQAMELDACTHCGACSSHCSVGIAYDLISNVYVLPSEKISAAKALFKGKHLSRRELAVIANGFFFCVNCNRCTEVCPAGINLQDLWIDIREILLKSEDPVYYMLSNLSFFRGLKRDTLSLDDYRQPIVRLREDVARKYKQIDQRTGSINLSQLDTGMTRRLSMSLQGESSSSCFTCTTCSLVCPVVANFKNPNDMLGLLPHQIVHAANLGVLNPIFGSNMLWSCLGCYECQENCPQGVQVADVFYELKNIAIECFNQNLQGDQGDRLCN